MLLVTMMLNNIISNKGAKCMTINISNFYINTPLKRPKYMNLRPINIPQEVINMYELFIMAIEDESAYIKVQKGMYGLPHAGILAQEILVELLMGIFRATSCMYYGRAIG